MIFGLFVRRLSGAATGATGAATGAGAGGAVGMTTGLGNAVGAVDGATASGLEVKIRRKLLRIVSKKPPPLWRRR